VRAFRNNEFIAINDGSNIANLQVIIDMDKTDVDTIIGISKSAGISIIGQLIESQDKGSPHV
jgi:asparaginyl-tRNA synthetase